MLTLMNTLSINIEIIIPSAIQNMINPIILHIMRSIPYQALTVANGYYLYTSDIISSIAALTSSSSVLSAELPLNLSIRSGTMSITFVTVS